MRFTQRKRFCTTTRSPADHQFRVLGWNGFKTIANEALASTIRTLIMVQRVDRQITGQSSVVAAVDIISDGG